MTTTSDPVTRFLARFGLRDVGHGAVAFVGTSLAALNITNVPMNKAALLAAVPTVGAVLFRQLFPHVTVNAAELGTAIADVEHALAKVKAPPVVGKLIATAEPIVAAGIADLAPATPNPGAPVPVATPAPVPVATPVVVTPPVAAPPAPPAAV